jgi:hypothetical protein
MNQVKNSQSRYKSISEYLVALSFFILLGLIFFGYPPTVPTPLSDTGFYILVDTDSTVYLIGDTVSTTLYLVNDLPHPVRFPTFDRVAVTTFSNGELNDNAFDAVIDRSTGTSLVLKECSSKQIWPEKLSFHPNETGSFVISVDLYRDKELSGQGTGVVTILSHVSAGFLDVSVKLNRVSFDRTASVSLVFTNNAAYEITYGSYYLIERKEADVWVEVSPFPPNAAWTSALWILNPGKTNRQSIKIDTLEPGQYRISKTLNLDDSDRSMKYTLEFEITG